MKVVNLIVQNLDIFKEILIRELISKNISYVQIENEFHFLDKIYRFHDSKIDEPRIEQMIINTQIELSNPNRGLPEIMDFNNISNEKNFIDEFKNEEYNDNLPKNKNHMKSFIKKTNSSYQNKFNNYYKNKH